MRAIIFDVCLIILSIADTATTILTWITWYEIFSGYFAGFVIIEVFVQFAHLLMWYGIENKKFYHYLFFLLPPLVPYLIWAERCGYRSSDNCYAWLLETGEEYMGISANTIMESFPQAILQIIVMVKYKEQATTLIPIISLIISLFSVFFLIMTSSPSGRWSINSRHLPTFLFRLCCALSDGFGLFSIISWLCYSLASSPPSSFNYPTTAATTVIKIPYLAPNVNFLSPFTVVFAVLVLVVAVVFGVMGSIDILCLNRRKDGVRYVFLSFAIGLIKWLPFSIFFQCTTLILLSFFVLQQSEKWCDDIIIDFLNQAPNQDDRRLRVKVLREYGNKERSKNDSNSEIDIDIDIGITIDVDEEEAADRLVGSRYCCHLLWKCENDLKKKWKISNNKWAIFGLRIFLVFWVLRATYSFSYPTIMLATSSSSSLLSTYRLQFSLTIVHLIFNACCLLLTPSMVRHHRLAFLISTFRCTDVSTAQSIYQRVRERRVVYNVTVLAIYIANSHSLTTTPTAATTTATTTTATTTTTIYSNSHLHSTSRSTTTATLDDHIIILLPRILNFAGFFQNDHNNAKHNQNLQNSIAQFFASMTLCKFFHNATHASHLAGQREVLHIPHHLTEQREVPNALYHLNLAKQEQEEDANDSNDPLVSRRNTNGGNHYHYHHHNNRQVVRPQKK